MGNKQRFIIISDVHGFYDEMIKALDKVDFNPEIDFLISLGDNTDRGPKPKEVIDYLVTLPNKKLIKGNHSSLLTDCILRGFPYSYDWHNGTAQTIIDLAPNAKTFNEACAVAYEGVKDFIDKMVNYFETKNYIFVHSFIPLKCNDNLPVYYTRNRQFEWNPDWRDAHFSEWEQARWVNPFDLIDRGFNRTKKVVVFGHWATEHKWAKIENREEFDNKARFEPYYGDGFIGLDCTTALSNKVGVVVLEDELIND